MLVLSRKVSETIQIGDSVTVTVVRIGPNSVRLGIEAPGLPIRRDDAVTGVSEFFEKELNHETGTERKAASAGAGDVASA